MFGHWPEILILLFLALLVFGPKRMIDMGSAFGKAFREFREATKELSWPGLGGGDDASPKQSTLSRLSQLSQSLGGDGEEEVYYGPNGPHAATVVESAPAENQPQEELPEKADAEQAER
jgi:TatA/E family protein of Tat protein translocase